MLLVKESYLREPLQEKVEPNMHDIDDDDDDEEEEEETLSFCEFSMNSDADTWENSSRESQNSSFKSSEGDEYFEFFSGELTTGATISHAPPENIIFCGKLISNKQPISENTKKIQNMKPKRNKKSRVFKWKWNIASIFHKKRTSRKNASSSKSTSARKGSSQTVVGSYKSLPAPETSEQGHNIRRKHSKKHELSVDKMSFFTSIGKSRWHLFLFGITKFRPEMELRDMKKRQSRRRSSTMFRLENDDTNNGNACMSRSKGFWAVLRALSCSGDHRATDIVKATTVPQT